FPTSASAGRTRPGQASFRSHGSRDLGAARQKLSDRVQESDGVARSQVTMTALKRLANTLALGSLLESLRNDHGGYELVAHWQQGEFHHDIVLRVLEPGELPAAYLVVATNCNGGIKELFAFH